MKKDSIVLIICALIFISCSIGLYFAAANHTTVHLDLDSPGYDRIGLNFAQHNQLINPERGYVIPVQTLGYPLFLGLIYKIFGHQYNWVIVIQVLLSLLAGLIIFVLAKQLFGEQVALVSTCLFSINLGFLIYSQFLLTEVLLATLLLAGIERFLAFCKTTNTIVLAQSGLLFGLSVAVKPVALFYILILLFLLLVRFRNWRYLILFSSCFFVPVFGYMLHNKKMFDVFTVAPVMNENIYYYFLAKLIAQHDHISYQTALQKMNDVLDGKNHNDEERWVEPKKIFYEFVFKSPFYVAYLWLFNVMKTFGGLYSSQMKLLINPELKGTETSFFQKSGSSRARLHAYLTDGIESSFLCIIAYWQFIWMMLQQVLLAMSFFVIFKSREYFLISFFVLTIGYFAFITGHDGCARYRMMFEGLYIILAAYGLVIIWYWLKNRKIVPKYAIPVSGG